ncbi:MAG TPA: ATP-binding protein [Gemmatimonadales bacterium]|nr:ATP-binding protein [Gemmatimonadales bacterium]
MTVPDPLAEVRAEFAAGLGRRIDTMRAAIAGLEGGFHAADADALYRAAHALTGTAASFGAEGLAHVANDLESLARGWLERGQTVPEEWRVAAAAIAELDMAAREYRATVPSGVLRSPAARLAVVGELTSLINAAVDMREIFRGAILKVQRVLDFRRASVVLIDASASHYSLHTLYDNVHGGFVPGEAVFPIDQGITGEAIRSGRPILVAALPGTEGILLQQGRRVSAMIVPLHVGDRVIGALNFGHEEPGHYTDEDLDWAVVLGRQIETSLYYSKLLSTIAEQRAALAREHAAVQRQRNQLEALIDASDAAIMLVGPERQIAHANAEMARLVGIPREAVLGAGLDNVHRFLARSFVDPTALAAQESALLGDVALRDRVELSFPRRAVYQRVVAPVRETDGSLLGHIVLYRDVTHEVAVERAKSEFVSVVSHELRTPMTSVKTSLSLLLAGVAGPVDAAVRELLEIALRNGDRLIRLVNDLLDLSRLEAGRMELHFEPVSLGAAIESSVEAVAAFASGQGVTIATFPPADALHVLGERDRVEQVMVNLISNAIKFSPRGGKVEVRWRHDADAAVTEVSDEGPGIPPDKLLAIFEPFRQLDSSTTREHGGAGLGLAISRGIVEALGGRLWAESEPGAGSRFFVRLPLAAGPRAPVELPRALGEPRVATVLIAHAEPDWQRLMSARAGAEGWRVVPATTGAAALECLRSAPVDVVVVALELADMHGLALLQQLQSEPQLCDIPVVLVAEPDTSRARDFGADAAPTVEEVVDRARRLLAVPPRPVVLVVEDDPTVRATLGKMLRRAGYACLMAVDGKQGLDFARARKPHVLISDYKMPGMSGLVLLRELRGDPALKRVPAIILTGHVTRALTQQARGLSARVLGKPVARGDLLAEIERLISAA